MMDEQRIEESNFQLFREMLSDPIVQKCTTSSSKQKSKVRKARVGRKTAIKPVKSQLSVEDENENNAEELGEFIDVCLYQLHINQSLTKGAVPCYRDLLLTPKGSENTYILNLDQYSIPDTNLLSPHLTNITTVQHSPTQHQRNTTNIFPTCRITNSS